MTLQLVSLNSLIAVSVERNTLGFLSGLLEIAQEEMGAFADVYLRLSMEDAAFFLTTTWEELLPSDFCRLVNDFPGPPRNGNAPITYRYLVTDEATAEFLGSEARGFSWAMSLRHNRLMLEHPTTGEFHGVIIRGL